MPHGHIPCLYLDGSYNPNNSSSSSSLENSRKGKVLLYFHGNAEDLGITYQYLTVLKDILGVRIIAMEYRGYGLYNEDKSSDGLLIDSLAVYDYINREMGVPEEDIYL